MKPIQFGQIYEDRDGEQRTPIGRSIGISMWVTYTRDSGARRWSMPWSEWRKLHAGCPDGGLLEVDE